MASSKQQRLPKILHGIDMSAIIEVSDDENHGEGSDQPTPPLISRSSRITRQRVNGEAPALYNAKFHPMDDVIRPTAAKRYHNEAFEPDEDTASSEGCMTHVGSSDIEDHNISMPVRRQWSTGIRHSGRLDAPSRKPVDYNMKRHPQDAQLRLLEKSSSLHKRPRLSGHKQYDYSPDLQKDHDEDEEKEDSDHDELPSIEDTPIPTKRVKHTMRPSIERRRIFIGDSDDESGTSNEDHDKKTTPHATRLLHIETDVEDEIVGATTRSANNQMDGEQTTLSPQYAMDVETVAKDDETSSEADLTGPFTPDEMLEGRRFSSAAQLINDGTDIEDDDTFGTTKVDNAAATVHSDRHQRTDGVAIDLLASRHRLNAIVVRNDDIEMGVKVGPNPSTSKLPSILKVAVATQSSHNQTLDAAEEDLLALTSLSDSRAIPTIDSMTENKAKSQPIVTLSPEEVIPGSSSSQTDNDILGALLDVTEQVLTATQQEKVNSLSLTDHHQASSLRVSVLKAPSPKPEDAALSAQREGPQLPQCQSIQVESHALPPGQNAKIGTVATSLAGTACTSTFSAAALAPSLFASFPARLNQSTALGEVSTSVEQARMHFPASLLSSAGASPGSSYTFGTGPRSTTAPADTDSGAYNGSNTATETKTGPDTTDSLRRVQTATASLLVPNPSTSSFGTFRSPSLPTYAPERPSTFGLPSNPQTTSTDNDTPDTADEGETTDEEDEEDDDEDSAFPRYPLSELVENSIDASRQKPPSSRSSSIRSTNYPHGDSSLEPARPPVPIANVSPFAPRLNPLGLATTTEPDGQERRIPPGFDHYGSRTDLTSSVFPAPRLPPRLPDSSSFSAGQPRSSPIAEIPIGARGISRPPGALPPRRVPGTEPIIVFEDGPFSSHGRHLDGEDYESPDEGNNWDKENYDAEEYPVAELAEIAGGMATSEDEVV
ncbi:hypothetical protein FKW77_009366 [Venturia effusa]|uniref:Uncharacterized protein n=1 Tax=Venturia effusa TaxID=50376 RepID=A0A517LCY5_9PEZI|nr:hypothetical protein FKW77_009366 [Venturia effusa]